VKHVNSQYAIEVNNLSKHFKLYAHPRQILSELFLGRKIPTFTALEDISFTVGKGEVVGIMGRNGAGKSTLLRIITGTLNASSGTVNVNGRISAILELGTGFNLEYTGRENIVAGGACMGMSHAQIMDRMEDIIEFSELGDFIDHPFKTYSSGMQARLTFATAVAIEPEILIVDEALSVGDAKFQAKCYAKIQQFRDSGGSILLVSHSDNVITQFCDRAVLLERGKLLMDDAPRTVTRTYLEMIYVHEDRSVVIPGAAKEDKLTSDSNTIERIRPLIADYTIFDLARNSLPSKCCDTLPKDDLTIAEREKLKLKYYTKNNVQPMTLSSGIAKRVGPHDAAEIIDLALLDQNGQYATFLESGKRYRIMAVCAFYMVVEPYAIGFQICDLKGTTIFGVDTIPYSGILSFPKIIPGTILKCFLDIDMHLTNGDFFVSAFLSNPQNGGCLIDGYTDYLHISVQPSSFIYTSSLVNLNSDFRLFIENI